MGWAGMLLDRPWWPWMRAVPLKSFRCPGEQHPHLPVLGNESSHGAGRGGAGSQDPKAGRRMRVWVTEFPFSHSVTPAFISPVPGTQS